MKNLYQYNLKDVNKIIEIYGWIRKIRKLGDIIFIDLRSKNKILQVVFKKEQLGNFSLKNEDILYIKGKIVERKNKNLNLSTGEIEIIVSDFEVVSSSTKQLPLIVDEKTDALENIRMKYRYLDLRRPNVYSLFVKRSKFNRIIREFFYDRDFLEIETPIITRKTFGGANELTVNSINHKDKEYVLVQSPQVYKQLLMYAGMENYFQIAKCFRDEDSRSDRQIEFTQLDLELSFSSEDEIRALIEDLLQEIFKKILKKDLKTPFKKISFKESKEDYGTDKPDLRIKNKLLNLTDLFKKEIKSFNFINDLLNDKVNVVRGITFEEEVPKNWIKKIEKEFKSYYDDFKLTWIRVEDNKIIDGSLKKFSNQEIDALSNKFRLKTYTLFLMIDQKENTSEYLGILRNRVARKLNLIDPKDFNFLWVVDWPLFEIDEEGTIEPSHNPFTDIKGDISLDEFLTVKRNDFKTLTKFNSSAYDIVLNGVEVGGGSLRINNVQMQEKIFEILGLSEEEISENFGWLLEAQSYAIPPHGGIALGLDRIFALLFNQSSIREVIAFPKTSRGTDELTGAPTLKKLNK